MCIPSQQCLNITLITVFSHLHSRDRVFRLNLKNVSMTSCEVGTQEKLIFPPVVSKTLPLPCQVQKAKLVETHKQTHSHVGRSQSPNKLQHLNSLLGPRTSLKHLNKYNTFEGMFRAKLSVLGGLLAHTHTHTEPLSHYMNISGMVFIDQQSKNGWEPFLSFFAFVLFSDFSSFSTVAFVRIRLDFFLLSNDLCYLLFSFFFGSPFSDSAKVWTFHAHGKSVCLPPIFVYRRKKNQTLIKWSAISNKLNGTAEASPVVSCWPT